MTASAKPVRAEKSLDQRKEEAARSERELASQPPDPRLQIKRAAALRKRVCEMAAALAAAEAEVAQIPR
jgi:hypothetical protein